MNDYNSNWIFCYDFKQIPRVIDGKTTISIIPENKRLKEKIHEWFVANMAEYPEVNVEHGWVKFHNSEDAQLFGLAFAEYL